MMARSYVGEFNAPDFPAGLDWLNTDFWTYC